MTSAATLEAELGGLGDQRVRDRNDRGGCDRGLQPEPTSIAPPATAPPANLAPPPVAVFKTAAEARSAREAWVGLAAERGATAGADAARVRALECGLEAWRLGGEDADREWLRRAADAYLLRPDARERDRARAILRKVGSQGKRQSG